MPGVLSINSISLQYGSNKRLDHASLIALSIAGISEGKESFAKPGTHDHPDESPQSIVNNNSCTMHQLVYEIRSYVAIHLMLLH